MKWWERHGVLEEQVKDLLHYHRGGGAVLELFHPGQPTNSQGTVSRDLNINSAGDVPRSSFGMVLRPSMTQRSSEMHDGD